MKATEPLSEPPPAPVTAPAPAAAAARPPWPLQAQYDALLQRFPVLVEHWPLAIGIKAKLLELATAGELGLTPRELVQVMNRHCHSNRYLKALANDGAYRHDLEGKVTEPVADNHRLFAATQLLARTARKRNLVPKVIV